MPTDEEMSVTDPDCLFCKIVAGAIPADVIAETETTLAFRDIDPKAPVHVLVIPKEHLPSLGDASPEHREVLGDVLLTARDVASSEGATVSGFRTVVNSGRDAGQEVHHLHAHVLAGRELGWPPG